MEAGRDAVRCVQKVSSRPLQTFIATIVESRTVSDIRWLSGQNRPIFSSLSPCIRCPH